MACASSAWTTAKASPVRSPAPGAIVARVTLAARPRPDPGPGRALVDDRSVTWDALPVAASQTADVTVWAALSLVGLPR